MAEEEQERGRGFRVQDRRRFSPATGEPRETESVDQTAEEPRTAKLEEVAASQQGTSGSASAAISEEISFSSFILGLSTQALMFLGEVQPTANQPVSTDLAAAQQMIDVLAMLQQRTAGNLDSSEEKMLEHILFDLRLRYVDVVRKNRASAQEKAKG